MNAAEILTVVDHGAIKVRLTSWDNEINFGRVDVELVTPTQADFNRAFKNDPDGYRKLAKLCNRRRKSKKPKIGFATLKAC